MPSPAHRIYLPDAPVSTGDCFDVQGPEAHHAVRVKRLRIGELVEILSGTGMAALAEVVEIESKSKGRTTLRLRVESVEHLPSVHPRVIVRCPAPKGDALETMIDQLSQVGAEAWSHLRTTRSEREPRNIDRVERTAIESLKQCGRAHTMRIEPPSDLVTLLAHHAPGRLVADATGSAELPPIGDSVELLVGPEGGWSPEERLAFADAGTPLIRFGPHVLRIETAAVVGVACILHQAQKSGGLI